MTAPGDAFGESAHEDEANPPAVTRPPRQPVWGGPWHPTAPPHAADHTHATYPLPDVPPGYPSDLPTDYPEPIAPTPPGYGQPLSYGGPPYPPPQFGTPATGHGPGSLWHPGEYPGNYPGGYYPPNYLGGYGATQPGMNVMAIASLISSFAGLVCCIGSILAIVLGAIALEQTKRTRQEGYGLAVAGIVIGIATLLVSLTVAVFALHSH
ncbi:DUF4190 domain-containing protein [Mycobacterium leprae]|uniref:DUF4190 domain-containing protein n=1 Tax=Mycobacterium leprae TaxID=1769 RepID=A0AAD0P5S3_MYCLR|nr:DUF4190 domain-containing protein [Mycobacterium leprae]AWV49010.1 DUF4190 domain-containing protein [Mycobacterium leprae]OAR21219.1 hypothetical protein A8144_07405 [Mycobacterium leprae 3125609]OAX71111.1 hypothetical protein A3216_07975 [Mycobacterium leprae 7935681]